jgi:hypothetical protein
MEYDPEEVLEATVHVFHGVRNDNYEAVKRALETLAIKNGRTEHLKGHNQGFVLGILTGALGATALYGLLGVLL